MDRVSVASGKVNASGLAGGLAANAASFAIAAAAAAASIVGLPLVPKLLAISAGFYAAALVAGKAATDPPEPDQLFREPVEPSPIELPEISPTSELDEAMQSLLESYALVLADLEALNETRSRILSAREAGDQAALDLQISSYRRLQQLMADHASGVFSVTPRAVEAVRATDELEVERLEAASAEWRAAATGPPPDLQRAWAESGLPGETLNALDLLVREGLPREIPPIHKSLQVASEMLVGLLAAEQEQPPIEDDR